MQHAIPTVHVEEMWEQIPPTTVRLAFHSVQPAPTCVQARGLLFGRQWRVCRRDGGQFTLATTSVQLAMTTVHMTTTTVHMTQMVVHDARMTV